MEKPQPYEPATLIIDDLEDVLPVARVLLKQGAYIEIARNGEEVDCTYSLYYWFD